MVEGGLRAVFGVIYSMGYMLLTVITVGMGHGTTLLATGLISLGFLLFSLALLGIVNGYRPWRATLSDTKTSVVTLMIIGYAIHAGFFLLFEAGDGFRYTIDYFRLEPLVLTIGIGWWVIGQIGFWLMYSWSNRKGLP